MKNGLIIEEDGTQSYYLNNLLHKIDGPARIEPDGTEIWYFFNVLHRENGPAYKGLFDYRAWYIKGLRHRIDGPTIESGSYRKWYYKGEYINCASQNEFEKLIKFLAFI